MTQSRAFSLTYIRPRQENASFSTAILDKYAVNVLHQEEVQVKWWRNKGCRLFPVTFTASRALWCMKRLQWGWHLVNRPPGHISPYLWQHKHRSSVIRGGTDLSCSYLCTQILSITLFCPLSVPLFMHFSVLSKQKVSAIWTSRFSFWGILGRACPRAYLSAGPDPDSPLHGWKNERLTAGQLAPYASCVCVNRSELVTLPSSETGAYMSGVSKPSHGGMNK